MKNIHISLIAIAAAFVLMGEMPCAAQELEDLRLKESRIEAKVPKKLHTIKPFWGIPIPNSGEEEEVEVIGSLYVSRADEASIPRWICWNLDLASDSNERFKFEELIPKDKRPGSIEQIRAAINECYRWAWRKPYGMTCIVTGPIYLENDSTSPYSWYVTVCKRENAAKMFALGYSSIAFKVPMHAQGDISVYDQSVTVNMVEFLTHYNLYPHLPASVQEQVEEVTGYELFCNFQEIDESLLEKYIVEFEHDDDIVEHINE